MEKTCVSVVVSMYNVEKYISECVESIINQTYGNLEIILVNDGSTDRTLEICRQYAEKDKRITVIDKENGGATSCRVAGLERAAGEYVYFSDSDDVLYPETIEKLLNACVDNNAQIAVCGFKKFGLEEQEFRVKSDSAVIEKAEAFENIVYSYVNSMQGDPMNIYTFYWNRIYKIDCLSVNDFISDRVCTREDTYTNLLVLDRIDRIAVVDEILYKYRTNPNSITVAYRDGKFEKDLYFINFVCEYLRKNNLHCDDRVKKMTAGIAYGNIDNFCKSGSFALFKNGMKKISGEKIFDTAIKDGEGVSSIQKIAGIFYSKKLYFLLYVFRKLVFKMKGLSV